ncbi:MAG TPA: dipeptidase, partial [Chloroflexia bacterium]|nr:dipeptidase [Chloroflexia bacterium]
MKGTMSDTPTIPIFDGHNDVLLRMHLAGDPAGETFFKRTDKGHIDLPRAREGGFGGGFFAIFVPDPTTPVPDPLFNTPDNAEPYPPIEHDYALRSATAMSALLFRVEATSQGQLKVVRTASELSTCLENGTLATILHFEGAEPIDTGLDALEVFYKAGLRSLGLVWSRSNAFGHGVPFRFPHSPDTGPGLTDAGKALVQACNYFHIMVDLSHLNEQGFWDVARLSDAPLVATHSNAHAICPSARNLTDKQLDAIKESDGVVGVNFATAFLREDGKRNPGTPVDIVVRHIDYLVERLGVERVGFGSDYDGAVVLDALGDVSRLPVLMDALRTHGYDDATLRKLAHENWVRVLRMTWQ